MWGEALDWGLLKLRIGAVGWAGPWLRLYVYFQFLFGDYLHSCFFYHDRFNAGPLHHYVLTPGGKTQYLSELKSGSEVLVCRMRDGQCLTRSVLVGRCKVERRPLLLIEVETDDGKRSSLFMQNAETCRVARVHGDGTVAGESVVGLSPGDRILVRADTKARHCGLACVSFSFPTLPSSPYPEPEHAQY